MVIKKSKSKFMMIGGNGGTMNNSIGAITIQNCEQYTYLGAIFMQDCGVKSATTAHYKHKFTLVLKFISFMEKCWFSDFPFWIKRIVFDAAVLSALLHNAESWFCHTLNYIESAMSLIKSLLFVRKTTPKNICLVDSGYPSVSAKIRTMQKRFV